MRVKPVPVQKFIHATLPPSKPFLLVTFLASPIGPPASALAGCWLASQSFTQQSAWCRPRRPYADFFTAKETGSSVFYLGETDLLKAEILGTLGLWFKCAGAKAMANIPKNSTGESDSAAVTDPAPPWHPHAELGLTSALPPTRVRILACLNQNQAGTVDSFPECFSRWAVSYN